MQVPPHASQDSALLPHPTVATARAPFSDIGNDTAGVQVDQLPSATTALPGRSPSVCTADEAQLDQAQQRIMCVD